MKFADVDAAAPTVEMPVCRNTLQSWRPGSTVRRPSERRFAAVVDDVLTTLGAARHQAIDHQLKRCCSFCYLLRGRVTEGNQGRTVGVCCLRGSFVA